MMHVNKEGAEDALGNSSIAAADLKAAEDVMVSISPFMLRPGVRVVQGNTTHGDGKTALRQIASDQSRFVGVSVLDGAEVVIRELDDRHNWAKIEAGSGSAGWVKSRNLHWQLADPAESTLEDLSSSLLE